MEKFGIAVKGFIIKDNNLLIVKREDNDPHKPGVWEIPGGRVEIGKDPKDELIREIKEETNLDIKVLDPLNTQHFTRDDGQVITMIIYLCATNNTKVKLSSEHSEYEWIDLNKSKNKLIDFFHEEVDICRILFKDN